MNLHIKYFEDHNNYDSYMVNEPLLPNLSYCKDSEHMHLNPYIEKRVVAKFNISTTTVNTSINIMNNNATTYFSEIEINGVVQDNIQSTYKFSNVGIVTVKYTLKNTNMIGQRSFYQCSSLVSIFIPNEVTTIKEQAFEQCSNLNQVILPNTLTTIEQSAFLNCTLLHDIKLPDSLTSLGNQAFQSSGLYFIEIPNNITVIPESCFNSCISLKNIKIGTSVLTISNEAFSSCLALESLYIPRNVTTIGINGFKDCSSLKYLSLGSNITTIQSAAFENCTALEIIVSYALTAPTISSDVFKGIKHDGTLYVHYESTGYENWIQNNQSYYLGFYDWIMISQLI